MITKSLTFLPKNKKAEQAGMRFIELFQFMFILGICVFSFIMAISTMMNLNAKVPEDLEYKLLIDRALHSQDCFAYQDETGRVHPQIIDLAKFNDATLKRCMVLGGMPYEFRFRIPITGKIINGRQVYREANSSDWYGFGFDVSLKEPAITINETGGKELSEIEIQVKEVNRG